MKNNARRIFSFNKSDADPRHRPAGRHLSRPGIRVACLSALILGLLACTAVAMEAADRTGSSAAADVDSRWLPWIGSWRLVPDTVGETDDRQTLEYVLSIRPGNDRNSIMMKALQGETVLYDDSIATNGLAQPLKEQKCSGWYRYTWSETGKRLIFQSKSSCADESSQEISGLWIINKYGEWLDIQLLQKQDSRIITLRRYSPVKSDSKDSGQYPVARAQTSRIPAGTSLSMSEVIELNQKVAPEILEAALVEYYEPFPINSRTLTDLSDAGVSSQIVDLMVALSFPEKFTVERHTVSITPKSESGGEGYAVVPAYYIVDPFFPWFWTPYNWSFYGGFGWGWYPSYYPPYYPGHPIVKPASSGRLVAGRGYTRVHPSGSSVAKPRSAGSGSLISAGSARTGARPNARVYSSRGSSGSMPSPSSDSPRVVSPPVSSGRVSSPSSGGGGSVSYSSGGGVSVSSPGSGGSPSASPGGYSGGSGGSKAKQR